MENQDTLVFTIKEDERSRNLRKQYTDELVARVFRQYGLMLRMINAAFGRQTVYDYIVKNLRDQGIHLTNTRVNSFTLTESKETSGNADEEKEHHDVGCSIKNDSTLDGGRFGAV